MADEPCVVILAAGKGTRFRQAAGDDSDKLLASCVGLDGVMRPLLEQVLANIPAQLSRRILVTTPQRPAIAELAKAYGCQLLCIGSQGMGDSLSAAVAASADASGWLVLLGDMPFIPAAITLQVSQALADAPIVTTRWQQQRGHPVAFSHVYASALMALSGDVGARSVMQGQPVTVFEVEHPGVLWDVDEPQSLVMPATLFH